MIKMTSIGLDTYQMSVPACVSTLRKMMFCVMIALGVETSDTTIPNKVHFFAHTHSIVCSESLGSFEYDP